MAAITTRVQTDGVTPTVTTKGSPLTNAEIDDNFINLNKFKVEKDASGNVSVGGTLGVTGAMTASSTITASGYMSATGTMYVNAAVSTYKYVAFRSANVDRWLIGTNSTSEAGSNAGADFFLNAYNDAGGYLSTPILVTRSNGLITVNNGITVNGTTSLPSTTTFRNEGVAGEGGQFQLQKATSGTTLGGDLIVDYNANNFRIFDAGGTNKGVYVDISAAANGAASLLLHTSNYNSYAPTLTGTGASGPWNIAARALGGSDGTGILTSAITTVSRSSISNANQYAYGVFWEFKNSTALPGIGGNYAGLLTLAPYAGTTASTGDSSYQLSFSSASINSTSAPTLRIRAGIDTTWGSWAKVYTDADATTAATASKLVLRDSSNVAFAAHFSSTDTDGSTDVAYFLGKKTSENLHKSFTLANATLALQGDGMAADKAGFRGVPVVTQDANYTLTAADNGKCLRHTSATAHTYTISANATLALPVGFTFTVDAANGSGIVTVAVTTDTQRLAGAGTTGNRSVAANGLATWIKVATTEWKCSGAGLT